MPSPSEVAGFAGEGLSTKQLSLPSLEGLSTKQLSVPSLEPLAGNS